MYICHFSGIDESARGGITGEEPQYLQKRVDMPFSPVLFFCIHINLFSTPRTLQMCHRILQMISDKRIIFATYNREFDYDYAHIKNSLFIKM